MGAPRVPPLNPSETIVLSVLFFSFQQGPRLGETAMAGAQRVAADGSGCGGGKDRRVRGRFTHARHAHTEPAQHASERQGTAAGTVRPVTVPLLLSYNFFLVQSY